MFIDHNIFICFLSIALIITLLFLCFVCLLPFSRCYCDESVYFDKNSERQRLSARAKNQQFFTVENVFVSKVSVFRFILYKKRTMAVNVDVLKEYLNVSDMEKTREHLNSQGITSLSVSEVETKQK